MKILILGGTGAIGKALLPELSIENNEIFITSRQKRMSNRQNVHYIRGDAHNLEFLNILLESHWDSIVDFMVYSADELQERIEFILSKTDQYFFLSSCRVYADTDSIITEESPRLLDVSNDKVFLTTDEYSLIKAQEENIIRRQKTNNWTIVRPYITYNYNRLQLGVFEKEQWLYRALHGKKILFSNEIANSITSLTYALDVTKILARMITEKKGKGEIVQLVSTQSILWSEILKIYLDIIEEYTGKRPQVVMIDSMEEKLPGITKFNKYQIRYDRACNRKFDASKADKIYGETIEFTDVRAGLYHCLSTFLNDGEKFGEIQWWLEAYMDIVTGDKAKLRDIKSTKDKLKYIIWRYTPYLKYIKRGIT